MHTWTKTLLYGGMSCSLMKMTIVTFVGKVGETCEHHPNQEVREHQVGLYKGLYKVYLNMRLGPVCRL